MPDDPAGVTAVPVAARGAALGAAIYCGVDLGASATKVALVDAAGTLRGWSVRPSGVDYRGAALASREEALQRAGRAAGEVARTVATGYGRDNVGFADDRRTEIQCHGVGVYHHLPHALTVVDIGGQDNKVIRLDDAGHRLHFRMNRKCAAGTGAFLEEIALRLDLPLGSLDALAAGSTEAVQLSSFCTVFAKTEILGHLRRGVAVGAIVRGAFAAVVSRVVEMDPLAGEVVLTGGVVAHNPTVAALLEGRLGRAVVVPPHPQLAGALGAALIARQGPTHAAEEGLDA
jgi:predicted CoA-substrate-specific enzyme activase